MEAILPFKIKNEQKFFEFALKLGFDEMQTYKFIYVMQQSDLDIFPKMHDERINLLIYCWELCENYKLKLSPDEWELPEEMETILKLLVPWSLDIWFSKEWDKCKPYLKLGLIHCINRARDLLMRMPDMMQINWDFLLLYNLTPWNVPYLRNLNVTKEKTLETGAQSIETEEQPATIEDSSYVKLEQLPLIVLRLVKLFDQCSIDMVKTLCMRVIAAWNKIYHAELEVSSSRLPYIPPEDKRCLLLICHIYLMAIYESDDVKGYVIDNMINNIRFYYQGFQTSKAVYAMDNLEYTPARFIALTKIHLRLQKREFFDFFIWNKYDTSLVNLFGVVSQAYKSYLLGNLLMDINNMNEDDFAANVPLYKRLMNSYVNEREKSELFMLAELDKLEAQRYAHNIIVTMKNMTDFKSKICKGNRMSNIGNYENSDDALALAVVVKDGEKDVEMKETPVKSEVVEDSDCSEVGEVDDKESDLRLDPIFQNIPNNENILYYVYDVLAKKDYKGWYFAKIVLLIKIIGHELNMIETWRYHPGLTIDFMLNLETKLSNHYADLAKIFKDHAFIEQEFWLTAFYLNPTNESYETVKRLGMRNNRKRTDEQTKLVMSIDNIDAKYGLLSSTIDVKDIASLANTEEPDGDYNPLFCALKSLHLPDSLIKDMLTAIFLPRNRNFAWVVDWTEMRTRCKILLNNTKEKKRFVELNMAEANDRLKFLNIDYEKYQNRPQLDYGTIEQGYETLMNREDFDKSDEEDEEEEDFEDDDDVYENQKSGRGGRKLEIKQEEQKLEDENSQEDDPYLTGKRRTRARVAATVASFLFQSIPRVTRKKKIQNNELEAKPDNDTKAKDEDTKDNDDKSNSPITTSESLTPPPDTDTDNKDDEDSNDVVKKNIKECLNERPSFLNSTPDFLPLIDIWNVEKSDIQAIDSNCVSLMESSTILRRMAKLKLINTQTGLGCNNREAIDENEMLIMNTDYPMKTIFSIPKSDIKNINMTSNSKDDAPSKSKEDDKNIVVPSIIKEDDKVDTSSSDKEEYSDPYAHEAVPKKFLTSRTKKVHERKSDDFSMNQEPFSTTDNSNDSLKSDMSTAALRDSEEASESCLENNSKINSENNDSNEEEPDKTDKCKNTSIKSDTLKQDEEVETEHGNDNESNKNQEKNKDAGSDQTTIIEYLPEKPTDVEKPNAEQSDEIQTTDEMNKSITEISDKSTDADFVLIQSAKKAITTYDADDSDLTKADDAKNKPISYRKPIEEYENDAESQLVGHAAEEMEKPTNQGIEDELKGNIKLPSFPSLDDVSMDSLRVDENEESEEAEVEEESEGKKHMKQICLTKPVKVVLQKLRPADVKNLRQPKVRVKRIIMEKSMQEFEAKRKNLAEKVYLDTDDSSNISSIANSDDAYRPPKFKRKIIRRRHSLRQIRSSESDNDSINSEDIKIMSISSERFIRERRLSTPNSSTPPNDSASNSLPCHTSASARASPHLIVTPRSASGLKLRISNAEHAAQPRSRKKLKPSVVVDDDDIIQLSSSSDVSAGGSCNALHPIVEVIEFDDNPLYEEEIII